MIAIGNLLIALGSILKMVLFLYMWIVIISALISWVNPDPYNPIVRFLRSATEPALRPIRRRIGVFGGIDISPLILIAAIYLIQGFILQSLIDYGIQLKGGF